jgi:hypothetical protein
VKEVRRLVENIVVTFGFSLDRCDSRDSVNNSGKAWGGRGRRGSNGPGSDGTSTHSATTKDTDPGSAG